MNYANSERLGANPEDMLSAGNLEFQQEFTTSHQVFKLHPPLLQRNSIKNH